MRINSTIILLFVVAKLLFASPLSASEGFIETFDGTGSYSSTNGRCVGLDNPDWTINGDGEILDGGYTFYNNPHEDERTHLDRISRPLAYSCGFVERIEIKNAFLGPNDLFDPPTTINLNRLSHGFERGGWSVWLVETDTNINDWKLGTFFETAGFLTVPAGTHIALQAHYDNELSEVTFGYDNDIGDQMPLIEFGPFPLDDPGRSMVSIFTALASGYGIGSGILDSWSLTCDGPSGDFNGDGVLDLTDIDLLSQTVRAGTHDPAFDLNSDQVVDVRDRTIWVEDLRRTYFGDANLDDEFNSLDLVTVFQTAEYEDAIIENSTWSTGDWTDDAEFNSRDLVLAFTHGGYEQGPRPVVPSVPEPGFLGLWAVAGLVAMKSWLIRP